jgi:Zn finger protein HypA/HybF involved in hydrogenase expression
MVFHKMFLEKYYTPVSRHVLVAEFRYAILLNFYAMLTYPRLSAIVQQLLQRAPVPEAIRIVMGELTLDESDLREQWRSLVSPTPLANTILHLRIVPAEQQCMVCFLIYHPNDKETACPQCKSMGAKIISGEEFYFESD